MFKSAPLSMFNVGVKLASPIHDHRHKLLLGAGIEITSDLLLKLHKRGVRSVVIETKDWLRLTAFEAKGKVNKALPNRPPVTSDYRTETSDELDKCIGESPLCEVTASGKPFAELLQARGATRYDKAEMDGLFAHHQQTIQQVGQLFHQLSQGQIVSADELQKVSLGAMERASSDLDLFVCMGINPVADNALFAHSTNVATLAIAVGTTLGLDESSLSDLGAGCLVHDAGMHHMDEKVHRSQNILDLTEFQAITKHPILVADLLHEQLAGVSERVRKVVYQIHERCHGGGYPRGWKAERIDPLAKIAAVADTYVALVSPRAYRQAMLPYFAMKKMLEDVREGLFDSTVVRGLLQTVSLFPLGSFCELSDGRLAKVIRSNGPAYDRPIVEAWRRPYLSLEPKVIDLSEAEEKIVKPLTALR